MSALFQYFERTIKGMETYFSNDKIVVILMFVLLLLWLGEKKPNSEANNRFLIYTMAMSLLLLLPFTAVVAVIYQSAYYDYEWVWSMVPVVAAVGYGGVLLYEKSRTEKNGKAVWWAALLALLFVCGNQGCLKTAGSDEVEKRACAEEIVVLLESVATEQIPVLWGPQEIMQETRRTTGEILLVYGRDMWDLKSGAYDYEAYSEEHIQAYEWMDSISMLAAEAHGAKEAALYEKYNITEQLPEVFSHMLESGVNVIVLPESASKNLDEIILKTIEGKNHKVQKEYVEQYVVYLLKQ